MKKIIVFFLYQVRILVIFFTIVFCNSYFVFANQDGFDLFVKACQYQGHNPSMILSGYAEITTTSRSEPPISNETKDFLVKDAKKRITDARQLQTVLDSIEETVTISQKGGDVIRREKNLFLGNESETGWRRSESSAKHKDVSTWPQAMVMLKHGNKKSNGICIEQTGSRNTRIGYDFLTFTEFSRWGRMQGLPSVMASLVLLDGTPPDKFKFTSNGIKKLKTEIENIQKKDASFVLLKVTGETFYDDDKSKAVIVESSYKGKVTQRYWIDASRGYVCPMIQIYEFNSEELLEQYKSSDYFLHQESGLWFPKKYSELRKNASTKSILEDADYLIDPNTFWFNRKVSIKEFSIDIPENEFIVDERNKNETKVYKSITKGELTLAQSGLELEKMQWLERKSPPMEYVVQRNHWTISRILCILIGIVLIILGISLKIRKHFLNCKKFLFIALLFISGCSQSFDQNELIILTQPTTLDFGKVRVTDSPVQMNFSLHNKGVNPVTILDITSGCGCTVIEPPQKILQAGAEISIPVKVDLAGHYGNFENIIQIKTDVLTEPLKLAVTGKIVADIWFSSQSLRCTAISGQRATTTLELHTIDYPDIFFDFSNIEDGITVKEISRTTDYEETVIKFNVTIEIGEKDVVTRALTLIPTNPNIAPINVPIYCYREDDPTISPTFYTKTVALGTVHAGESREVSIHGDSDLISVIKQVTYQGVPDDITVHLQTLDKIDVLHIVFQFSDKIDTKIIEGNIQFVTQGKRTFTIPVSGLLTKHN
jgi:hypothetical protein